MRQKEPLAALTCAGVGGKWIQHCPLSWEQEDRPGDAAVFSSGNQDESFDKTGLGKRELKEFRE